MITGECFCGAIKYEYSGQLINARSCHCSRCRKAYGGAASAYAEVETGKFKWKSGQEHLMRFPADEEWGKGFCGKCGSMLCGTFNGSVRGVALGCLNGSPDIKLQMHMFVGSKANWDELPQGAVKQFDEFPPD